MRYRITCLTPTLVGDGQKLSPIDYMVWKDHVNVLDQRRIFKLLSKGPRLDGYLAQLKKADRLDFASWGGFAQNFAGRRIPFENVSAIPHWEKATPEHLSIPTFAVSPSGPYIPGTAIKGALRTGAVSDRWTEGSMRDLSERLLSEDRLPRHPALRAEEAVLGGAGSSRMKRFAVGDSASTTHAGMKVYLLRVSTLIPKAEANTSLAGSRKGAPSTPKESQNRLLYGQRWPPRARFSKDYGQIRLRKIAQNCSNRAIATPQKLLAHHKTYAELAGLTHLHATIGDLEKKRLGRRCATRRLRIINRLGRGFARQIGLPRNRGRVVQKNPAPNELLSTSNTDRIAVSEDQEGNIPRQSAS